jgi:starch synthase
MLAIVSKSTYSCCMFESSIDLNEIRSALTDAGHTVVGFATLALKKGNDVRLDVSKKYEAQLNDLRSQALTLAERADETVSEIEDRVEPLVHRVTDRLPAPAATVARTIQSQGRALRQKAHEAVIGALTVDPVVQADAPAAKSPKAEKAETMESTPAKPSPKKTAKITAKTATAKTSAKINKTTSAVKSAAKSAKTPLKKGVKAATAQAAKTAK